MCEVPAGCTGDRRRWVHYIGGLVDIWSVLVVSGIQKLHAEVIAVTDQPKNASVIDRGGCIMEDVEQGITIFGGFLEAIL